MEDELQALGLDKLSDRASAVGVPKSETMAALDAADKAALIKLILIASKPASTGAEEAVPPPDASTTHDEAAPSELKPLVSRSGTQVFEWGECDWAQGESWDGIVPINVASSPAWTFHPEDKSKERDAMMVIVNIKDRVKSGKFIVGFDFAGSANADETGLSEAVKQEDKEVWDEMTKASKDWQAAEGAEKEAIFTSRIVPAVMKTRWWTLFREQVVGSAKAHCQKDSKIRCIIFCVHGGPISMVEQRRMAQILTSVDIPGDRKPQFAIKCGTLEEMEEVLGICLATHSVCCVWVLVWVWAWVWVCRHLRVLSLHVHERTSQFCAHTSVRPLYSNSSSKQHYRTNA
eukprot:COSAG05_NODE_794_length_7287_cov_45.558431_2_plen_346_part_00